MSRYNKGFTLIELLVVIAIIGVLAAVVLGSLYSAREKGNQGAIQGSMSGARLQAEIFYDGDGSRTYGPVVASDECPTAGLTMFVVDTTIQDAIQAAADAGGTIAGTRCAAGSPGAAVSTANSWAIAVSYKDGSGAWCADSTSKAGEITVASLDTPGLGGGAGAAAVCPFP